MWKFTNTYFRRISETKITNANLETSVFNIPGYRFEFVRMPTPLAFGGVGLFIDEQYNYRDIRKTANNEFQSLWTEISFVKKKKKHYLRYYV